jgi:UDP-glucose 4-epimerase
MILLTGGAGFIGTHTCVELIEAGFEILVFDNFSNSSEVSLKRVEKITGRSSRYVQGDVRSRTDLISVFSSFSISAVIHLAGLKSVGESVGCPLRYFENNLSGTLLLCEVMTTYGCKKLVFSSSATVYGDSKKVPIFEHYPLSVTSPYGRSKLMVEGVLSDLYQSDKSWSLVILRYFNPIGAHVSGLIGEDPSGVPNNLMPYITQVAVAKRDKLKIFGDDYPTPDGTGVRDYIHVVDLAKGHVQALQSMLSPSLLICNLGTGIGYSVKDVISAFEKASGINIPYQIVERRPGDVAQCYADVSKAKAFLAWEAKYDIDRMCEDSWRWQRMNPNGYRDEA